MEGKQLSNIFSGAIEATAMLKQSQRPSIGVISVAAAVPYREVRTPFDFEGLPCTVSSISCSVSRSSRMWAYSSPRVAVGFELAVAAATEQSGYVPRQITLTGL
jgi:hypothetical protein